MLEVVEAYLHFADSAVTAALTLRCTRTRRPYFDVAAPWAGGGERMSGCRSHALSTVSLSAPLSRYVEEYDGCQLRHRSPFFQY